MSTTISSTTSTASSSNTNRITGLVSGIDTDSVVEQLLSADQAKIDKVKQKIQIDEWKIDAYREVTTTVQAFYDTYFDPLSDTSLTSANSLSSYATTYADTTSSNYVTLTGLSGSDTGTFSITSAVKATAATLTSSDVSTAVGGTADFSSLSSSANTLSFTLNGTTQEITIDTSTTTAATLGTVIQDALDTAFGDGRIVVTYDTSTYAISFDGQYGTDTFSIDADSSALAVIGLTSSSNLSNKVDLDTNISDMDNALGTTFSGSAGDIAFTINGTSFSFNSSETSIQDIIDEVNASSDIDVTMSYDDATDGFSIKSNDTGATDELVIADKTGNLMETFRLVGTDKGSDASITYTCDGTSTTIVRSSNSFTYEGITYEIKQDFTSDTDSTTSTPDPIEATITNDTTDTYDFISGFVEAYNGLIESLNSTLDEEYDRDYPPLTDAQKEEMSDEEIESWEEKAKTGLLRNDSSISKLLTEMRSILYDSVEGAGISLSEIGITTTSTYDEKGKLEIDETTLKEAIANNADGITKLFTSSSDTSYDKSLTSTSLSTKRYNESGIAQRLSDSIKDAIRTTTDSNGYKGSLLEKAGIVGDTSKTDNILYLEIQDFNDQVEEMNDRLEERSEVLYAKFAAMETALSNMNSQTSIITSMLGS